jgi:dimethylamine/trimethylamine dehydrogenase
VLFEPVQIGPKTLKNRFFAVPHSNGFGSHKPGMQARFRGTKAEGGWAAVCVEVTAIDPESDRNPTPTPGRLWDDDDVANLALVADDVHSHGALAGIELWYAGANSNLSPSRLPPAAPSQLASEVYPYTFPRELTLDEIPGMVERYAVAARRAREAGFDIVYVYGGHSYGLPMQFLSPFYNQRDDEYGGTLQRRARFWLEAIGAVRNAIGDDCAVAVRLGLDPSGAYGVSFDDAAAFMRLADPIVDLWDVVSSTRAEPWLDMRPSRLAEPDYQLGLFGPIRAATAKPLVGVERLTSPDRMADLVRSGIVDLIGGARPSIADPFLPRKVEEGRADDIRECIGCNVCLMRSKISDHIACTQNATAGEEYRRGWGPERFEPAANADRDVLVVGGGAAGMECAIVLAKRGMRRVHLVEACAELGGYAALAASLPGLSEWRRVVDWRRGQLAKLRNVEMILGTELDAAATREYGAEVVVVAAGARWVETGISHLAHEPLPGFDLGHVLTPERVLRGEGENATRAVVYDCEGYFMGAGIAELLAARGTQVTLVTPHTLVGPVLDAPLEGWWTRRRLESVGVVSRVETVLAEVEPDACVLDRYGSRERVDADLVVLITSRRSNDSLYRELVADRDALEREGVEAVYAVGDCVAPRMLADAIFDGHRLAREIDTADPSQPLPALRERALVARTPV